MSVAVYPGSFDPITNGHLDIINRAAKLFDTVIVAVLNNHKKSPMFTVDERIELVERSLVAESNIQVESFTGLLVDYMKKKKAIAVIRGLRTVADFQSEMAMALMNRSLREEVETVFLAAPATHIFVSSSLVKEVAMFGGDVSSFVPAHVNTALGVKLSI